MTSWQDPPLTRRQARERERAAASERGTATSPVSRRAGTDQPVAAGEIPHGFAAPAPVGSTNVSASQESTMPASTFDDVLRQPPAPERVFRAPAGEAAEPVTTPVHLPPRGSEHTLTRRELRAMREARESETTPAADSLTSAQTEAIIAAAPIAQPDRDPFSAHTAAVTPPTASQAAMPATSLRPVASPAASHPAAPVPLVGEAAGETAVAHRSNFQPPTGHWSIGVDAPEHPAESAEGDRSRRTIAPTGPITTSNALIMPVVPSVDATGPIATATGEVLITGSIDLPRSLGSTGQHPTHFDSPALDKLIDESETTADDAAGVAPVRASKAVSSSGSTRGMIAPPKPRDGKLPAILAITAAVLAIGVIGLLIAGFAFHLF